MSHKKLFPEDESITLGGEELIKPIQLVPSEIWTKIHVNLSAPPTFSTSKLDPFMQSLESHAQAAKNAAKDSKSFARVCKLFNEIVRNSETTEAEKEAHHAELALSMLKNS